MNYKGGKQKRVCFVCEAEFLVYPGNTTQKHCSKACAYKNPERTSKAVKTRRSRGGYKFSEETRRKMSQAQKGRKTSEKTKDLLRAAVERRKRAGAKVNQYGAYKGGLENKLRLNLQRISKKKHADGSYTTKEWQELKEKSGNKCVFCHRAEADVTLSADHIVPLTKGGTNFIENIQPLCRSCNSKKGNRLISFYLLSKV